MQATDQGVEGGPQGGVVGLEWEVRVAESPQQYECGDTLGTHGPSSKAGFARQNPLSTAPTKWCRLPFAMERRPAPGFPSYPDGLETWGPGL